MGSSISLITKKRLLFLLISVAIVGALGVVAALGVRALAPKPRPEPMITPTSTSVLRLTPSILLTPQQGIEPGEMIVATGEGWQPGDEVSVELISPIGDRRYAAQATTAEDGNWIAPFFFPSESPWSELSSVSVHVFSTVTGDEASAVLEVAVVVTTAPSTPTATGTSMPVRTPTSTTPPTAVPTETMLPTSRPTATATWTPVAMPTPTATPVILGWRGQYYGNRLLTGSPVLVREDADVNFVWGTAAPATGLPADAFSARWTRTLAFQGGSYRFYVTSDDGVRIWLDGVLIIDQWRDAPSLTHTVDRTLGAGNHTLRVEYYENTGAAQIRVWWERLGDFPQWRGEYFPRVDLSGAPILVRNDANINFDWGRHAPLGGVPADGFSARWNRSLWFDEGLYRFHAVVDDGLRLYVDGALIIDSWRDGARRELTADRKLPTGSHTVRVEYYERMGEALIKLWWEEVKSYPDWKGEYWSNRLLSGSPVLVRNDATIDFSWGGIAPATGLPADNFSARWTRTVDFEAATYRFHVRVDDGARLWLDDQLIIDTWRDGAVRDMSRDVALVRGTHNLRLEYYERTGEARIRVRWEKVAASYPDWKGEYWSNRRLEGKPALVRNDKQLDFEWGRGSAAVGLPADNFSARWTRDVVFKVGVYRFQVRADDGVRLYLDGKLLLDRWQDSDAKQVYNTDRNLTGKHRLVLEYYERTGEAKVWLSWKRISDLPTPTATKQPTPSPTATPTPVPTSTPRPTATATPTATPTVSTTPTATVEPMVTPTATPTPTIEPSATPTVTPQPTASATATPTVTTTPTVTPTTEPATTTVRINEVLPVPVPDGIDDEADEWIELYNMAPVAIDLSGWYVDDGEGGSAPYRMPEGAVLESAAYALFHGSTTGIVLEDSGDTVRLLDVNGKLVERVVFLELAPNASYSRDEYGIWHDDWAPSPGAPNLPPGTASPPGSGLTRRLPDVLPRGLGIGYSSLWIR